jgi:restriction endonuclease S subunit
MRYLALLGDLKMVKLSKFKIFLAENPKDRLDCNFNNPLYFEEIKLLSKSKYPKENLGNLGFVTDGDHGSPQYVEYGIPYLRAINIQEDKLVLENDLKFISLAYNDNIKKSMLKNGDVLLVTVGATIGKVAIVKDLKEESNISRDIALIRLDKEKIIPEYLYYFLMSDFGQVQIKHFISGALQDGLYLSNLNQLIILLPSLKEQEKIVKEINNKLIDAEEDLVKYNKISNEIYRYLSEKLFTLPKNKKVFTVSSDSLSDRLDCYFYCPELRLIWKGLKEIDSKDIEVVQTESLQYGNLMSKEFFEDNSKKMFKYLDIGGTNKDSDEIKSYEENLLINLPTRARQIANTYDVLIPRPIGSTETIVILPNEFKGQLYSTGFISIKNTKEDEAIILRGVLKSEIIQKQLFYLQSGSIQPEITPSNFKEHVLIPLPKGKFKEVMIKDITDYYKKLKYYFEQYKSKRINLKNDFIKLLIN